MKIFISWSGTPSQQVALALRDWLPDLFNGIELFVSSEDIRKGKRWPLEVSKELETSNFGIVCLTNGNLEAPWILFESGALSKYVKESSVFTLLTGGLKPSDIDGPLSHFQHTVFEKEDFYKLVKAVDEAQGQLKRDEPRLKKNFDRAWPELEENIKKAMLSAPPPRPEKKPDDLMREILDVVTSIAKNMPQRAEILEEVQKRYGASLFPEDPRPVRRFIANTGASALDAETFHDAIWAPTLKEIEAQHPEMFKLLDGCTAYLSSNILSVLFRDNKMRMAFTKSGYSDQLFAIASTYGNFIGIRFRGFVIGSPDWNTAEG